MARLLLALLIASVITACTSTRSAQLFPAPSTERCDRACQEAYVNGLPRVRTR